LCFWLSDRQKRRLSGTGASCTHWGEAGGSGEGEEGEEEGEGEIVIPPSSMDNDDTETRMW